jgi:hypothetical protein
MKDNGIYMYAAPFPDEGVREKTEVISEIFFNNEKFITKQNDTELQYLREEVIKLRERVAVLETQVNSLTKK